MESPRAPYLAAGELDLEQAFRLLKNGIYISRLHYLNWSDLENARVTGMTRYACYKVQAGQAVACIAPMRFDDSLYQIFGSGLEGLTHQTQRLADASTYGGRKTGMLETPGALISAMKFTL